MSERFTEFWTDLDASEKRQLADRADTSVAYLHQISSGYRNAGRKTIDSLKAADNRISFEMFFHSA